MTQGEALDVLKTGANVFLTGEPGSGKTHTINEYIAYLREHDTSVAVTASTGIAATHIGGMTVHAWSGIGVRDTLSATDLDAISSNESVVRRVRKAQVLIIDEVSMLSATVLDMVDAVCREVKGYQLPFGGIQVVLVGDFFQLPPVMRARVPQKAQLFDTSAPRFCFNSRAWGDAKFLVCYLTEQHRATDEALSRALTLMRRGELEDEDAFSAILERTHKPAAVPKDTPLLYTHNVSVDEINATALAKLPGTAQLLMMKSRGAPPLIESLKRGCLSPESLALKVGARVMCTRNNVREGVVNGALGVVVKFTDFDKYPVVELDDGRKVTFEPVEWSVEDGGKVRAAIEQVPLRLAWAITVHKSQGMTLDTAATDLSKAFEFGQGYVALSRVRSLDGLYLLGINARAFQVHPEVLEKDQSFRALSEATVTEFEGLGDEIDALHSQYLNALKR